MVDITLQICLILYIIELLNPISVLLSFQNIPDLTACSDQCQVPEFFCLFLGNFRIERDVKSKRYSSNSSCHRSCIIFANLAFFLGYFLFEKCVKLKNIFPFFPALQKLLLTINRKSDSSLSLSANFGER